MEIKTTDEIIDWYSDKCMDGSVTQKDTFTKWVRVDDIKKWLIEEGNIPQSDGKILIKLLDELSKGD